MEKFVTRSTSEGLVLYTCPLFLDQHIDGNHNQHVHSPPSTIHLLKLTIDSDARASEILTCNEFLADVMN